MADASLPSLQDLWMGVLTVGGLVLAHFFRKRDEELEEHGRQIQHSAAERARIEAKGSAELSRLELKMSEGYATKDSMRLLFQETQSANRETAARLEKQIDETKSEIKTTNHKLDSMQTAILSELAKKT